MYYKIEERYLFEKSTDQSPKNSSKKQNKKNKKRTHTHTHRKKGNKISDATYKKNQKYYCTFFLNRQRI